MGGLSQWGGVGPGEGGGRGGRGRFFFPLLTLFFVCFSIFVELRWSLGVFIIEKCLHNTDILALCTSCEALAALGAGGAGAERSRAGGSGAGVRGSREGGMGIRGWGESVAGGSGTGGGSRKGVPGQGVRGREVQGRGGPGLVRFRAGGSGRGGSEAGGVRGLGVWWLRRCTVAPAQPRTGAPTPGTDPPSLPLVVQCSTCGVILQSMALVTPATESKRA